MVWYKRFLSISEIIVLKVIFVAIPLSRKRTLKRNPRNNQQSRAERAFWE